MRTLLRSIGTAALLATIALSAGAASVFGATPGAAAPERMTIDDSHCFVDVDYTYCFEMTGSLHAVTLADGRINAVINLREKTTVLQGGAVIAVIRTTSLDQSRFVDGGLETFQTVEHTKIRGSYGDCQLTTVLRVADYQVVIDRWNLVCK